MSPAPDPPPRPPTLAERLLGTGARSARAVAGVTGIDRAAETALEEVLVGVIESEAVERALIRILEGPAFEEALGRALASPAVENAALDALDSELIDKVWEKLLASEEAQKLVERIAEAPEVRAAIAYQGVGLIADLGRQLRRVTKRLDGIVEGPLRRLGGRGPRQAGDDRAGLVTRAAAFVLDGGLMNGVFFAVSAIVALGAGLLFSDSDLSQEAVALGTTAWFIAFGGYQVFFWSLAGQTPGMRFLGVRLDPGDGATRLPPGRAVKRYLGIFVGALPLGAGLLAVALSERRRGLHDRWGETEVVYEEPAWGSAPHTAPPLPRTRR